MRTETKLTRPRTQKRVEHQCGRTTGFHDGLGREVATSSKVCQRPGRADVAVTKLRNVSFHDSEDWWGLLGAISRERGFSLTRIEERCER